MICLMCFRMDRHKDTSYPPPTDWLEALERSDADVAAGRIVDGEAVMQELDACIAEMEAAERSEPERSRRA